MTSEVPHLTIMIITSNLYATSPLSKKKPINNVLPARGCNDIKIGVVWPQISAHCLNLKSTRLRPLDEILQWNHRILRLTGESDQHRGRMWVNVGWWLEGHWDHLPCFRHRCEWIMCSSALSDLKSAAWIQSIIIITHYGYPALGWLRLTLTKISPPSAFSSHSLPNLWFRDVFPLLMPPIPSSCGLSLWFHRCSLHSEKFIFCPALF